MLRCDVSDLGPGGFCGRDSCYSHSLNLWLRPKPFHPQQPVVPPGRIVSRCEKGRNGSMSIPWVHAVSRQFPATLG
ncbi:iron-regulated membrane protein [Anopheles sinensis]|uniref:Iron-regulated membrane protein n=1 Tax=Anopheles sinensis TaxID=74873 RepID=A0A084WPZ7_ANOSI|nr:iron-regulated membrane protein [Anopheles sinensis]